jgi:quinol monooxygenase YgiN
MTTSKGQNPFVLLARITVKKGFVEEYLQIAATADEAVERSEPGMLLHNFDADPDDDHKFVWTEIYRCSDDFLVHADNPPVQEYVEKHGGLADEFLIEVYGNVSDQCIEKIQSIGVPFKHFKTTSVGYVRAEQFL